MSSNLFYIYLLICFHILRWAVGLYLFKYWYTWHEVVKFLIDFIFRFLKEAKSWSSRHGAVPDLILQQSRCPMSVKLTLIWKQCETPINWIIHELYLAANAMRGAVIFFLFTINTWQPWIILLFAAQRAQNGLNVRDTGWFRMTGTNRHKKIPTGSLNHPQTAPWTPS